MHLNKKTIAIGLNTYSGTVLLYTFTKRGDNITTRYTNFKFKLDVKYIALSAFLKYDRTN